MLALSIKSLAGALAPRRKIGVIVSSAAARRSAKRLLKSSQFDLESAEPGPAGVCVAAEALRQRQCDTLLLWGFGVSMSAELLPGGIVLATHVVDAETERRYNSVLYTPGHVDRRALLSTTQPQTMSSKRRMGMRYQTLIMDCESAAVAEYAYTHDLQFGSVCAVADAKVELWATRGRRLGRSPWAHFRRWAERHLPSPGYAIQRWQDRLRANRSLAGTAELLLLFLQSHHRHNQAIQSPTH